MADFTLVVGVDTNLSFTEMQSGINGIITKLNANPPKIKVQFDDASLKSMQDQITKLTNSVQKSSGNKTSGTSKAIKDIGDQAEKTANSVKKMNKTVDESGKAAKEAEAQQKAAAAAVKAYNNAIVQGEQKLRAWSAAEKSKNQSSRDAYKALNDSIEAMRRAKTAYDSGRGSVDDLRQKTEEYKTTLKSTEQVLRANGDATQTLGERIGGLAAKFSSWLSVSQVIMLAVRAVKQMVSASIELESAMAQLEIVTGASESELKQFKDTAVSLAKDLGQSVTDVAKSIEVFSRLGYSLPDATELSKYATILANVASVSTDEATTGLTSIIKGFNLNVSDAEHVADVLVEVGQKYAVSAGEMMEAYERSGAALNATNTSFEKSAGLIAAANAAVQDSSTVGTALKTISARIRGSKTDLDELGESTDDLAEGFSKYASEIKALTGFDIMVDGTTDTFKDLYDIMEGIAGVWDKLTDTQQARVAEILGGTRQLQVISSILGNWGDAAGAYETAMNAAGAASKANSVYMKTAAAHIGQFKAAFQELSSNLIKSGFITTIIDIGTTILSILNTVVKLIDSLGGLNTVLTATAGILLTIHIDNIKKSLESIPKIISQLTYTGKHLQGASGFFEVFKSVYQSARTEGVSSFKAFFSAVSKGFGEVIASASELQIAMGTITALTTGLMIARNAIMRYDSNKRQGYESAYSSSVVDLSKTDNIYSAYQAYERAKQSLDGNVQSKNALEKATLDLAKALGVEGDAAKLTSDEIENLTRKELESAYGDAEANVVAARQKLVGSMRTIRESTAQGLIKTWAFAEFGTNLDTASVEDSAATLVKVYELLRQKRTELIESGQEETVGYKNIDAAITLLKGDIEDLQSATNTQAIIEERLNKITGQNAEAQKDAATATAEHSKEAANAAERIANATKESVKALWASDDFSAAKDSLAAIIDSTGKLTSKNIDDLVDSSEDLAKVLELDGVNAEFLALILERELKGKDGFDLITDSALRLNQALAGVQDGLKAATAELQKYQDATSSEKGDVAEQYGNAYKKFVEDWDAGRTGTNAVQAAIELFIPDSVLQSLDYDLQAAGELLSSELYQRIFSDEGDYGANFANYIRETFGNALDGIVEIR